MTTKAPTESCNFRITPISDDKYHSQCVFIGYYCPQNSSSPTPCPAGRANPNTEGKSINDCGLCPVNHFNKWEAQAGCYFCGGAATQPEQGQTTCQCTGSGRDFQVNYRCYKL